ncbi:hypothetical protein ROSEINA2194_03884 [Roseburia inulinivorans DSM 16841]|uniref:Uncharacterized protein n=1 Tax=Roseburia inulinivorans DSM 16841 TaxID=622312 RepID=C0FYP4_9FIRM|nr:hypothetical protein ROSEINA2194_03884 [Roseburia inulinivorans DSM 16841]
MMKRYVSIFIVLIVLVIGVFFVHQSSTSHLSMDIVNSIIKSKGINNVTWEDFEKYTYQDIGSGNYIYQYELPNGFYLYLSGSALDTPPTYIYIVDRNGNRIDLKK